MASVQNQRAYLSKRTSPAGFLRTLFSIVCDADKRFAHADGADAGRRSFFEGVNCCRRREHEKYQKTASHRKYYAKCARFCQDCFGSPYHIGDITPLIVLYDNDFFALALLWLQP